MRALLLKTRKGTTSGFSVSDWRQVLAHLGFGFEVEKERREVVAAKVTTPSGEVFTIRKQHGYRRVGFYGLRDGEWRGDLLAWTAHKGHPVADLAAAALGMPTHEQERQLREYKARDWSNTGTCGVCELNVKMTPEQRLVHHGYQRPGDGAIHGDCFGVGYPPHELSPEAAQGWLEVIRRSVRSLRNWLEVLEQGGAAELPESPYGYGSKKMVRPHEFGWAHALAINTAATRDELRSAEADEATFSKKVGEWAPEDLPEIRVARLEEQIAAAVQKQRRRMA